MKFEYHERKSITNESKHGINFVEAQEIWSDRCRVVIKATTRGEERQLTIGKIADRLWTAVWTRRGRNIRLISVRRARDDERRKYKENDNSGRI